MGRTVTDGACPADMRYENKIATTATEEIPERWVPACVVRCKQADGSLSLIRFAAMPEHQLIARCEKLWNRGRLIRLSLTKYEWRRG